MIVADLSPGELDTALQQGLSLRAGPVVFRITSNLSRISEGVGLLYAEHPIESDSFADFHVGVALPNSIRRWVFPHARFLIDGESPFNPLPADQAFPLLEWGLNWCVTAYCATYLILHAAVVERNGQALLLPAPPGSGKSTLCAGLINRGWRLLSDELALIEVGSTMLVPIPRPVSLKNASIDVIRGFSPEVIMSREVHETVKGRVAHMRPPRQSVIRADEKCRPGWIVLPKYAAGESMNVELMPKAEAVVRMAENAFNYATHGRRGFEVLGDIVDQSTCLRFSYSDLESATAFLSDLADKS